MASDVNKSAATASTSSCAVRPVRHLSSRTLFGDAPEIRIEHLGQVYRLRCTRNGKLILNK